MTEENKLYKFWKQQYELALEADDIGYMEHSLMKMQDALDNPPIEKEEDETQLELFFYSDLMKPDNPPAGRYRIDNDFELYLDKKPNILRRLLVKLIFGARWIDE